MRAPRVSILPARGRNIEDALDFAALPPASPGDVAELAFMP
jgi:hypothetical protein